MVDLNRFFRPMDGRMQVDEALYGQVQMCERMAEAMSRNSSHSLYIIDYNAKGFIYVSPNPLFLCGHTPNEVMAMGYGFYEKVVPAEEVQMLLEINEAGFRFFYSHPREERLTMSIDYDFHLCYGEGNRQLIHHQLTPIQLDAEGNIWLALCSVSLSTAKSEGNVVCSVGRGSEHYAYSFASKRWKLLPQTVLSEREADILRLSIRGFNMKQIGEQLFIDVNTVKYHRRHLFQKLGVANITEAIGLAESMRLI